MPQCRKHMTSDMTRDMTRVMRHMMISVMMCMSKTSESQDDDSMLMCLSNSQDKMMIACRCFSRTHTVMLS